VHFGPKMVRNAAHIAFFNTLTVATLSPCVPAAFRQWERRSHAFPLEMIPGSCVARSSEVRDLP